MPGALPGLPSASSGSAGDMTTTSEKPLAVVTGASSGIGYELAKQFATHGFDVLIAAEDDDIATAARDLRGLAGAVVRDVTVRPPPPRPRAPPPSPRRAAAPAGRSTRSR